MRQKRHLGHISTHFWHGSRPVVIGPHTKCMTSMTSMTSTARVRARSRAPYIRKLFFLIFIFSKFQSDCWYGLIQENRKMPSEWLGVHGGRSYGPSPRGKSLPSPAVCGIRYTYSIWINRNLYAIWLNSCAVPYGCRCIPALPNTPTKDQ